MSGEGVDVAVAGFGPTAQVVAGLLAREGLTVRCLEREPAPFGFPRAAATDDEVLRILGGLGVDLGDRLLPGRAELEGVGGRVLPLLAPRPRPVGPPRLAFFHQPDLERALIARLPAGTARFGRTVAAVEQDATGVTVWSVPTGAPEAGAEPLRARYLLGCDGARSAVRAACGIAFPGRTAPQRWLVVDARLRRPQRPCDPRVRFTAGPARPAVALPLSAEHRRWEVLLGPGDDPDALAAPWRARTDLDLVRVAVYAHHARRAERWRAGRVLLLGDAAHVMPPFAGQGWGAGARDAANLAWKLGAVLRGEAPDALLDTYEGERRPDVAAHTRLTLALGGAIQTRRGRAARLRDALLAGAAATPVVRDWAGEGGPRPGGRARIGSAVVHRDGRIVALDELLGPGWAAVGVGADPARELARAERTRLAALGARFVRVDPRGRRPRRAGVIVLRPDGHRLDEPVRTLLGL